MFVSFVGSDFNEIKSISFCLMGCTFEILFESSFLLQGHRDSLCSPVDFRVYFSCLDLGSTFVPGVK